MRVGSEIETDSDIRPTKKKRNSHICDEITQTGHMSCSSVKMLQSNGELSM